MESKRLMSLIFLFVILFVSGCSLDKQDPIEQKGNIDNISEKNLDVAKEKIRIVAFGDSLTQGYGLNRNEAYPAQLQFLLDNKNYLTTVFNSGLSGETTTGAAQRVDWVLQLNPDIVILAIGANDAFRGVDIDIIEKNLRQIIESLLDNDVLIILGGMDIVENLGQTYVNEFENLYPRLAQEYNLYFIDSFLGRVAGNSDYNQVDEIHPTKEGYNIIVNENIFPVLEQVLQEKFN